MFVGEADVVIGSNCRPRALTRIQRCALVQRAPSRAQCKQACRSGVWYACCGGMRVFVLQESGIAGVLLCGSAMHRAVLVAQWIRHPPTKREIAGSSPVEDSLLRF